MKTMDSALILLVDDNPKNLQVLGNLLEGTYKTAVARTGAKALEFVKKRPPDLILLDIMMPGMDGFEVCAQLQAAPETREIPVIFLTAKTETEDIVKGFDLGAVDYVTKPFRKEELLARVQTHLALRHSKEALHQLNITKDKFFSIIAHDLRSPFTGLIGLTKFIVENIEDYSKEEIKELVGDLQLSAETVYALLENLLVWSRLQRGIIKNQPEPILLKHIAQQNIRLFTPTAAQKGITLSNRIQDDTPAYADHNSVNTVIRNLLSNALKFTHTGGTVTLSATPKDEQVEVAVADTGIGMNAEGRAKLFQLDQPYQRPGTAEEKGTGLGLILCKEFIERNGGTIWVESEVGQGTTFRFTLPTASTDGIT
ncbi:response regulator [candidate division KSB3 bacterium]|uniref:histidine kinase n=1 Tax=candidate division KSB3 bacterium TaxID=2044937 RepID=A0A9D5Q487_9BACT|nr:response regulator [candidate division KSB3 bacterium]MBD3323295.1 response regulator [candidate division KSB3 bacterium]